MYKKFMIRFFTGVILLLAMAAGLVVLFDPFYHYHGPIPGLKAVVTRKEYQCIGTIRNFIYDSLIIGSSTAENYNNRWFDEAFGCTSIKAIKSSGTTSDLDYYLTESFKTRELRNVFYSLDLFALGGDPDKNFLEEGMPLYLYDTNPFNDISYLFNKDVLFEDIPYLLAETFLDDYDEGTSYNWAQYKTFSKEEALAHYNRPEKADMKEASEYMQSVDGNIDLLVRQVENHPDTQFYFIFPPYSMLWWDNMNRSGELDQCYYAAQQAAERLLEYENVKMYYFQNDESIILNLDNYMDPVHFSAQINHYIVDEMKQNHYRLTADNARQEMQEMKELVDRIEEEWADLVSTEGKDS